ncbi:HipA N-terminal domain-containing protein [Psychroflexus sp. MES1-P1E]|uniref:HipA N-terminal domain-containing protein n=1 Tax=Psychroflexus sp. MES1-P1E TaxID=2058320 RepID=UPI00215517F9|nr:HipA N-terminal domain-containing protein [Psychroflexus sp. MES1-P1E]
MIADSLPDTFGHIIFQEWLTAREIQKVTPLEQLAYLGDPGMGAIEYKSSTCYAEFISVSLIINFTILLFKAVYTPTNKHITT